MPSQIFKFDYKENELKGRTITLGPRLRKELADYGISKIYLVGKEAERMGKHLKYIEACPESGPKERYVRVKIKKGKIKIPKRLIRHAKLKHDEICIIGLSSNYLAICNSKEIDEYSEKGFSNEELKEISEELTRAYRIKKLHESRKH